METKLGDFGADGPLGPDFKRQIEALTRFASQQKELLKPLIEHVQRQNKVWREASENMRKSLAPSFDVLERINAFLPPQGDIEKLILQYSPANWRNTDFDVERAITLASDAGLMLYGVPSAGIIAELNAVMDEKRLDEYLSQNSSRISLDVMEWLADGKPVLERYQRPLWEALINLRDGNYFAAQGVSSTIVEDVFRNLAPEENVRSGTLSSFLSMHDADEAPLFRFSWDLALVAAARSYLQSHLRPGQVPTSYNRHATAHLVEGTQQNAKNAVVAVLLATSFAHLMQGPDRPRNDVSERLQNYLAQPPRRAVAKAMPSQMSVAPEKISLNDGGDMEDTVMKHTTAMVFAGPKAIGSFGDESAWRIGLTCQVVDGGTSGPYWLCVMPGKKELAVMWNGLGIDEGVHSLILALALSFGDRQVIGILESTHNIVEGPEGLSPAPYWEIAPEVEAGLTSLLRERVKLGAIFIDEQSSLTEAMLAKLVGLGFSVDRHARIQTRG